LVERANQLRSLRDAAGLPGLRFHDFRHTVITELAELGVADHVLESSSGHLSQQRGNARDSGVSRRYVTIHVTIGLGRISTLR